MSIRKRWKRLKYWQRGGIVGVIIGIIYSISLIAVIKFLPENIQISLGIWLSLPILPIYTISYAFLGNSIESNWHVLFDSLLTFVLLGIAFGQSYYKWKVSKEPYWSLKNWSLILIAFLIMMLLIAVILFWLLTGEM